MVDVKDFAHKIFCGSLCDIRKYYAALKCIDHYSDDSSVIDSESSEHENSEGEDSGDKGSNDKNIKDKVEHIRECSDANELVEVWIGDYYVSLR